MFRRSLVIIATALMSFGAFGTTVAAVSIAGAGPVEVA